MKRKIFFIMLFSLVLTLFAENHNIERIGGITTDWFKNVKVVGDIAYCSTYFGLVLMDVSDKEHPEIIQRFETNGSSFELEIQDTLLYLCDGYAGFKIYSLAEPLEPFLIGICEDASGAGRMVIRDECAFVSCGRGGMSIVDISDPWQPQQISHVNQICDGIALLENYAYLGGDQIKIIDIEEPANPELLNYSEYGYDGELSILNDVLLGYLVFLSLENRENPELIYRHDRIGSACHDLIGNILFTSIGVPELRASTISGFNIENPENPIRVVSCIKQVGGATDIDYEEEYVYVTHGSEGFTICDFRDWENTREVSNYVNAANYENLTIHGDYAYVFDESGRFVVISLENPEEPEEIYETVWDDYYNDTYNIPLISTDDYLYAYYYFHYRNEQNQLQNFRGIYTYSLENPESPEIIHELSIDSDHELYDIKIDGNILYGTAFHTGLMVVSLENPSQPELLDIYGDYRRNLKFDYEDDILITATDFEMRETGFVVWDISDPHNLRILLEIDVEQSFRDIEIIGDYVYLSSIGENSIWIYSISDPMNPEYLSRIELTHHGMDLKEVNNLLYVMCFTPGIEIFSLDDPEHPELIGYYDTPHATKNIAIKDNIVYTASSSDFGVYDISAVQGMWFLALSAESHAFDSVMVDSSAAWELEMTNTGRLDRTITGLSLDSDVFACPFDSVFTLASGQDTTLTITFSPQADSLYTDTLTIACGDRTLPVALSGRGYLPDAVAETVDAPLEFGLSGAYPNPFNSTVRIDYCIPANQNVKLSIYDLSGREVCVIRNGLTGAGRRTAVWEAAAMPAGLYFCRLEAQAGATTKKLMLVR